MKTPKRLALISFIFLVISIASAVYAAYIPMTNSYGTISWDNFNKTIWISFFISVPAFCIFLATAITALITALITKVRLNKK